MNDKQQIEEKKEIAKEIDKVYPNAKFTNGWIAEVLYKLGYRKLPENAVVLSQDKYNRLKRDSELYEARHVEKVKLFAKAYNQGSKETARKVLDKVYDFGQGFFIERSFMEEDELYGILDEVKKLFLNVVEIKE